ncbi:hypothetical protein M433DRAFT_133131 [Acidomyces richmondensis BFW]|nr:hypothetical protein M433DRAFT_133131 [Acidomyces richmondensis BFW]
MMGIIKDEEQRQRCYLTQSNLPTFVNQERPTERKPPFSIALNQPLSHTCCQLDIVIPRNAADQFDTAVATNVGPLKYARAGENYYAPYALYQLTETSGNVIMLSEGRPGIDQVFSLRDGILRLEVDKPIYERMGLDAKPIRSEGRKHVKARFAIEINLRQPSMVSGKKGFEKVVRAFNEVLNFSLSWLFYDFRTQEIREGPISAFQPKVFELMGDNLTIDDISIPVFPDMINSADPTEATELLEWISLVGLASPRVRGTDQIDSILSRYNTPKLDDKLSPRMQALKRYRWHGFIPAPYILKVLLAAYKSTGVQWFAVSAVSFTSEAYTIFKTGNQTFAWEYMD